MPENNQTYMFSWKIHNCLLLLQILLLCMKKMVNTASSCPKFNIVKWSSDFSCVTFHVIMLFMHYIHAFYLSSFIMYMFRQCLWRTVCCQIVILSGFDITHISRYILHAPACLIGIWLHFMRIWRFWTIVNFVYI